MLMFSIISVSTNNNFSSILFHFSLLFLFTDPIETSGRCGYQLIKDNRKAKVVGGQDTYEGEFPWIVSVRKHGRHHVSYCFLYIDQNKIFGKEPFE